MNKTEFSVRLKELKADPSEFLAKFMKGYIDCSTCQEGEISYYQMLVFLEKQVGDHTDIFAELIGQTETRGGDMQGGKILYQPQVEKYYDAMEQEQNFKCPECFGTMLVTVHDHALRLKAATELIKREVPTLASVQVEHKNNKVMFAMVDQMTQEEQYQVSLIRFIDEIKRGMKPNLRQLVEIAGVEEPAQLVESLESGQ